MCSPCFLVVDEALTTRIQRRADSLIAGGMDPGEALESAHRSITGRRSDGRPVRHRPGKGAQ